MAENGRSISFRSCHLFLSVHARPLPSPKPIGVRSSGQSRRLAQRVATSAFDPGCVKTCADQKSLESYSNLPSDRAAGGRMVGSIEACDSRTQSARSAVLVAFLRFSTSLPPCHEPRAKRLSGWPVRTQFYAVMARRRFHTAKTLSGLPERLASWLEQDLFSGEEAHWRMPTARLCIGGWLAGHLYDEFGPYAPAFAMNKSFEPRPDRVPCVAAAKTTKLVAHRSCNAFGF